MSALDWSTPLEDLPLLVPTAPEWGRFALRHLGSLLNDHAHCEQKAAASALALIGRFSDKAQLVRPMIALAHEELHHFRQVLELIEARGEGLTPPESDPYVKALRQRGFRHPDGLGAFGDLLLVNAFVEARSCERFRLLAEALLGSDPPHDIADRERLGHFYRQLAAAEGRHWETFRDLALTACSAERVDRRLRAFAEIEGEIISERPLEARMH